MKRVAIAWLTAAAFLSGAIGCGAGASAQSSANQSRTSASEVLRGEVPALKHDALAGKSVDTRDLADAALVALITSGDTSSAEQLLGREFAAQDMSQGSDTYGEYKWRTGDPHVTDKNAVEFGSLSLGPIFLGFGNKLSPSFKALAQPHLRAALTALRNRNIRVTYTNIYLMNAVGLMLLGQVLHDGGAVSEAEQRMNAWMSHTKSTGLTEFSSPTYYTADLAALVQGYRYAASSADRATFRSALDYVWTDIAANFLPSSGKITPPYSRDYDFLRGIGSVNAWLKAEGWTTYQARSSNILFQHAALADDFRPGGYHPSASIKALAFSGPRDVASRWNDKPSGGLFSWIGRNIAIGCGSGRYGPQDKMFGVTFSGFNTPQAIIASDIYNNPYGTQKHVNTGTKHKPVHLVYNPGCVERSGNALMTSELKLGKLPPDAQTYTLNLLLPKAATIGINGSTVSLNSPTTIHVDPNSVVTASYGGAVAGFRFANFIGPVQPQMDLVADSEGLAAGVVRLRITILPNGVPAGRGAEHIAMLASVADNTSASTMANRLRAASLSSDLRGPDWVASANIGGESLQVTRPTSAPKTYGTVAINGQNVSPSGLTINGRSVASLAWTGHP